MRKLKTGVKLLVFPAACFACIVWTAVFVIVGMRMPRENVGQALLFIFAGLMMLLPWLVLVIAMWRRIRGNGDPGGRVDTANASPVSEVDSGDT